MDEFSTFTRAQVDRLSLGFGLERLVRNRKRRRKLERRGHVLRWSPDLQGWLWGPVAVFAPARRPGWSSLREAMKGRLGFFDVPESYFHRMETR